MSKANRLKNNSKKQEKKAAVESQKKAESDGLFIRKKSGDAFARNMEALKTCKWATPEFMDALKATKEIEVPIRSEIIFSGIKNPLSTVMIGFSTRKLHDALTRVRKKVRYVCIVEPELGVFKHLIVTEDISDLLTADAIDFVVGVRGELLVPELSQRFVGQISKAIPMSKTTIIANTEIMTDPFFYTTPELKQLSIEYIRIVKDTINQIKLSMGCSDDQFRRFELMMENKGHMLEAWKISPLWDKFSDIPAIVLGGGPSLEEFIQGYKNNPLLGNGLIIAADAVLKKLLDNGIKPHMVVRCERKRTNIFEGVTKDMTDGIYYCAYPWTPPEFFDLFTDVFYLFRSNGVCLFTTIKHGLVDGGVSSGNAAMEIAINLGCKNIILSGIDLCMKDGKTHVSGTQVEFNVENSKNKWTKILTNSGKEETTIPVWERCRREYIQQINKHYSKGKQFKVYNTATDGAVISLTEYKKIDDVASLFEKKVDVKAIIESLREKLTQEEKGSFQQKLMHATTKCKAFAENISVAEGLMKEQHQTTMREIEKLDMVIESSARDAFEKILMKDNNTANYNKLWASVSDAIDINFKKKLYNEILFRELIFDVMQLNLYHYENLCNGLINNFEEEYTRHFTYHNATKEFLVQARYYLEKFIALFS